jgi:endonuclease-3
MQTAFNFGAREDMEWIRGQLRLRFGSVRAFTALTPVGQLVKSSISGRTRDEISTAAFHRLVGIYPEWGDIARATPSDLEAVIRDVTYPEDKARHLRAALRDIAACRPDFDLMFLGGLGVERALAWLELLPGVGPKVAASTLNFSTLHMPAFVVDTHILRILCRFGFIGDNANSRTAYTVTMEILYDWSAADLIELHVLMKRLGQNICGADRAYCRDCPIGRRCQGAAARL